MSFSLLPNPIQTSTSSRPRTMLLPQTTISYPTGAPRPANQLIRIRMDCAASNPCSPSSRLFGDIDFTGTIEIDIAQRTIEFNGLLDQFPAFEAYATINDGAGVTMFQESPPTGNTVMNLPGLTGINAVGFRIPMETVSSTDCRRYKQGRGVVMSC